MREKKAPYGEMKAWVTYKRGPKVCFSVRVSWLNEDEQFLLDVLDLNFKGRDWRKLENLLIVPSLNKVSMLHLDQTLCRVISLSLHFLKREEASFQTRMEISYSINNDVLKRFSSEFEVRFAYLSWSEEDWGSRGEFLSTRAVRSSLSSLLDTYSLKGPIYQFGAPEGGEAVLVFYPYTNEFDSWHE